MLSMALPVPRPALLSLGISLARGRVLVRIAWVMAALMALVGAAVAAYLGREGRSAPLPSLLVLASAVYAYGAGFLVAFAGATQAFRRDRDEGIRALVEAHGATRGEYLVARAAGLAIVVAVAAVGATLLTGVIAMLSAARLGLFVETGGALLAALLATALFSVVVTLVALAALGGRTRMGGYFFLLLVFVAPEGLSAWTSQLVPGGWGRLVSLPGILTAFQEALTPGTFDGALLARSSAALVAALLVGGLAVRAELARIEAEGRP